MKPESSIKQGMSIAQDYISGKVSGFIHDDLDFRQFQLQQVMRLNPGLFQRFDPQLASEYYEMLKSREARKAFLWEDTRQVLGKDTENYPQEIGDCVSFGMKNACEYLTCTEIALGESHQKFRPVFPPYYYGTGRVYIGGGRLGNQDGSLGSWMAEAVTKFGTLFADDQNTPKYAGSVAKRWGDPSPRDDLDKFKDIATPRKLKYIQIRSWEELVVAVAGFRRPCTIASNYGFTMEPDSSGFHKKRGTWAHQMCVTPDTVITCDIPKVASEIKVEDKVYTHTGKVESVTQVHQREYSGDLYYIKSVGHLPLKITENHPILVCRDDVIDWIKAKDIKVGDYLVTPKLKIQNDSAMPNWETSPGQVTCELNPLVADDDMAWFMGLYAADGCAVENHKIQITLADHEVGFASKCAKVLMKLGLKPYVYQVPDKKAIRITGYSAVLANSFLHWFGKQTEKHLPEFLFNGWNLEKVLEGVFDGDGGYVRDGRAKRITNTSIQLINQCKNILHYLGKSPTLCKIVNHQEYAENWHPVYFLEWDAVQLKNRYWKDNYLLSKVVEIKKERYEGLVFNYEVDTDHSYLANGISVHNCWIGIDDEHAEPYVPNLNSWGNVHGLLRSFYDDSNWPIGMLRIHKRDAEGMIAQNECFAVFDFEGDVNDLLRKDLFYWGSV